MKPFELDDIEDVRIIIKAKGKNYSIIEKGGITKKEGRELRIAICLTLLEVFDIVDTSLEEIRDKKLLQS